ncbi:MbtH family protein [Streptomyces sp. NPDC006530]|uniref:MbtH family protein n=1 Tax=Streptomyces sp. NPDC006530 TaxID=3364750 RepID=UPI0036C97575
MSNPFDDQDGSFLVVVNGAGRPSLWPAFAPCPDGRQVALGAGPRDAALAFAEERWRDPRPREAVAAPVF